MPAKNAAGKWEWDKAGNVRFGISRGDAPIRRKAAGENLGGTNQSLASGPGNAEPDDRADHENHGDKQESDPLNFRGEKIDAFETAGKSNHQSNQNNCE